MAKMVGLDWRLMTADEALRVDEKPLAVEPLDAWCFCPACGSGGYHHLGARDHVPTGRPVAISPTTDPAAVETREHITRECLYCEHRWPQDTGNTGTHVPTFEDTLRDQLRNLAAAYSLPPAILRDTRPAP